MRAHGYAHLPRQSAAQVAWALAAAEACRPTPAPPFGPEVRFTAPTRKVGATARRHRVAAR